MQKILTKVKNDSEEYSASDDESNESYVDESSTEHYKEPDEGLQVGSDGIASVITTFPSPPAIPPQVSALPSDNLHEENNLVEDNIHSDEENIEFAIVNDDINNTFFVNNIDLVTKPSSSGINNNFSETEDECDESINLLNKWSICKSRKRKGARVRGGFRGRKCVRVRGDGVVARGKRLNVVGQRGGASGVAVQRIGARERPRGRGRGRGHRDYDGEEQQQCRRATELCGSGKRLNIKMLTAWKIMKILYLRNRRAYHTHVG